MKGGGIDHYDMGLTEWSLWFALPVFSTGSDPMNNLSGQGVCD